MIQWRTFQFDVGGVALVGHLFAPKTSAPIAAAVLTGPLTSVKEQAAGVYAKALAVRGFAALAFDHRYFGESGGMPRQFENPFVKAEDIRVAAAALQSLPELVELPLVGVGVCAGAGYMARAVAEDKRFSAFAGVAGYFGEATPHSMEASAASIARGRAAEARWKETGVAETIPAVAADGGDVAMPLREAYEYYGTSRGAVANYVNGFAVQSRAYTATFDSQGAAAHIEIPAIIVHSENALAPPLARRFIAALSGPHEELWLTSHGQIDFYDEVRLTDAAADAIANFVQRATNKH